MSIGGKLTLLSVTYICIHQIQMSPSLPTTNVTGGGREALGWRSGPDQRSLHRARNRIRCLPSGCQHARLVEMLG